MTGRRAEVRTHVGKLLFCKYTENAVKINNSQRFTAFTAKRCDYFFTTFYRISYKNLPPNLDPGSNNILFISAQIILASPDCGIQILALFLFRVFQVSCNEISLILISKLVTVD